MSYQGGIKTGALNSSTFHDLDDFSLASQYVEGYLEYRSGTEQTQIIELEASAAKMRGKAVWIKLVVAGVMLTSVFIPSTVAAPFFTQLPIAIREGTNVRITFAVNEPTPIEVAIIDGNGEIVRHLAAGMLGPNAPEPFVPNSLRQSLIWDRADDSGKTVPGAVKVRVGIGISARLEKYIGFDPYTFRTIVGLAVSPRGELYVLDTQSTYGASSIRVYDREGKYLRTLMPYSAQLTAEETEPIGQLKFPDGKRLPIVYNAHGQNLNPYSSGMKHQTMIFDAKTNLVFFSAVGTIVEHGPPRFILFMNERGGAGKDYGYIGPPLQKARNFLGGAGEGGTAYFEHVAVSPDGQFLYVSGSRMDKPRHVVYRLRPTDKEFPTPWLGELDKPGDDDAHFNAPHGIAVDRSGRIYIADRANNRVVIHASDGKRIGHFPVFDPLQVQVHPTSGHIYVSTQKTDERGRPLSFGVLKFEAFKEGRQPRQLAELSGGKGPVVMALDPTSTPTKLWLAVNAAFGQDLVPVTDTGEKLEVGKGLGRLGGLRQPMFISADMKRGKLYVTELANAQRQFDLAAGEMKIFPKGGEAVADREGVVYIIEGYPPNVYLYRYDSEGKPLNYPGTDSNKAGPINTASKGPNVGFRGHCIAPTGDIYILEMSFYGDGRVNAYGPDGKLKKEDLITHIPNGSTGIAVDRMGNVIVGPNIKSGEQPYPADFMPLLPPQSWVWWRRHRPEPWDRTYYNAYLYHWGMVFQFPPTGGGFYRDFKEVGQQGAPPMEIPKDAVVYRVGYLNGNVGVVGAKWGFHGYGPVAATNLNWGDPSCVCMGARMSVDDFCRVFVPDPFRFAVNVLDSKGNLLGRIGQYGNADDPDLSFAWGAYTACSGDRLFVGDTSNRRVAMIAVESAQSLIADVQ